MITRGQNFKEIPITLASGSSFGRYPKISIQKTYNMFVSDSWLVPYAGYQIAVNSSALNNAIQGRGIFASTKFGGLIAVQDNNVYLIKLTFNQQTHQITFPQITLLGSIASYTGVVYITENNKPQLVISDNQNLYVYDPSQSPSFQMVPGLNFVPGYITFHDSRILVAASQDSTYSPPANNTWRLSQLNEALLTVGGNPPFPSTAAFVGLLESKPDNVQAVVRFPSKGNMIFVMGSIVSEAWFDTGAQLFPYQRNNQFNIDYGCIQPATVAYMDEIVVWLAQNEKSGPIIMYSDGGMPKKITTDGIDHLFSTLQNPQDSQAFLYRQDGHLFYHINFYSDNLSLFYDFNTEKFYHASDQNLNYFIAAEIAFYQNQYYFVTKNNGNIFSFDTDFTTYQDVDKLNNIVVNEIPRISTCQNIRTPKQEYFILNDLGFTIETGETDYQQETIGPLNLITQDGKQLIAQQGVNEPIIFQTQDGNFLVTQDGKYLISQQDDPVDVYSFIAQQMGVLYITPSVDLFMSYDGGASFGSAYRYTLPGVGQRRNLLNWWQGGLGNDCVAQFHFNGIGRFLCSDGVANVRI